MNRYIRDIGDLQDAMEEAVEEAAEEARSEMQDRLDELQAELDTALEEQESMTRQLNEALSYIEDLENQ